MKKLAAILLAAATSFSAMATTVMAAPQKITVTVDGKEIVFDQAPVNINDRVMVPIRFVAEAMGWEVDYTFIYGDEIVDGQFQKEYYASMRKNLSDTDDTFFYITNIWLKTNEINGWCRGGNINFTNFDRPLIANSTIINDRTLVGIRDIAEGLYADVDWVDSTKTVVIKTKPVTEFPHYAEIAQGATDKANNNNSPQPSKPVTPVVEEPENNAYVVDDKFFSEMLDAANKERESVGAEKLVFNDTLMQAAQIRAEECASMGKISHTRPNGEKSATAVYEIDSIYKKKTVAEICHIHRIQESPSEVIGSWINSTKGHKEILLKSTYKNVGVGYKEENGDYYYVMMFSD